MKKQLLAFATATALGGLVGCAGEVEPAWRLDRPRILGARTAVVGDEARPSPHPGEAMEVELFTASKAVARGAFAAIAARTCQTNSNPSVFVCVGPEIATVLEKPANGDARLRFTAPDVGAPLLVFGIACVQGTARVDERSDKSVEGHCNVGEGQEFSIRIDPSENRQAIPSELSVSFDGTDFAEDGSCESTAPRAIAANDAEHTLRVTVPAAALEKGDAPILSHVVTHGKLAGLFTDEMSDGAWVIKWTATKDISQPSETGRFHFVLRDGRGGSTYFVRSVCLRK